MPCYDKKLEASREDFYNDMYRTRDVDCVISTSKLFFLHDFRGVLMQNLGCFFNKAMSSSLIVVGYEESGGIVTLEQVKIRHRVGRVNIG